MDREACQATVHGVAKSRTRLSTNTRGKGLGHFHLSNHLLLSETQKQADEWESFIEKKGKASGMPCSEAVDIRTLQVG